jgi:peptidoglycan hydrolase-like protein with peptidoglycan-binding domain
MATYTTLRNGAKGSEVKKLQEALMSAGYNVGSTGADGIYGTNTANAVKKFQSDNGLAVDGVAGEQTFGSLYKSAPSVQATTNKAPTTNNQSTTQKTPAQTPDYSQYSYDASSNDAYMQALGALQAAQKSVPTYGATYDAQLEDLYNQIVNREKFSYNLNADALYQQYKDQYTNLGNLAMQNTMGQAAALTGGYGNSYASTAGNQAYQAYLQQLNEVVPELYGMARDQYNQEGQDLLNQYSMLGDMRDTEYGRYQDELNQYWNNLNFQKQQADDAYDRGYNDYLNSYQMGVDADKTAYDREQDKLKWDYQKEQDAYSKEQDYGDKLVSLITTTGYQPNADELKAAGMKSEQVKSLTQYYNDNKKVDTGTGGKGETTTKPTTTTTTPNYDNDGLTKSQIKELQRIAGVKEDGYYGPETKKALGGKSASLAYKEYIAGDISVEIGFTGKTYNEAVNYMKSVGVPNDVAAFVLSQSEWQRKKNSGANTAEVADYNSYREYLADYVKYAVEEYGA